jgi:hypothetical protein
MKWYETLEALANIVRKSQKEFPDYNAVENAFLSGQFNIHGLPVMNLPATAELVWSISQHNFFNNK